MPKNVKVPPHFSPIFEAAEKFVEDYFKNQNFNPNQGTIEINGERYILVRAATMNGLSWLIEKKFIKKHNELKDLEIYEFKLPETGQVFNVALTPYFNDEGKVISNISIIQDNTLKNALEEDIRFFCQNLEEEIKARKIVEDQLALQYESLINSSKFAALGEMSGGIAHEINNPLTIISGKANQVKRSLESGHTNSEKMIQDLNKIENTVNRISKIIQGLKSFSRNSENDSKMSTKLSLVIEDTLSLCIERFKNSSIDLRVNNNCDANIHCRATQISQVIMNLLSNAFDAVEELDDKWVELSVILSSANSAIIKITDSGCGIKPDIVDKMLGPFFTTKKVGKGTGLGLSISKRIIEEHDGKLTYDQNSKNTCFVIEIPIFKEYPSVGADKKYA